MTMRDRELKRNASGYYDDTAYKAMLKVQEDEKMSIKPGDIYEFVGKNGKKITALIVAVGDHTSIMLQLQEENTGNSIVVISRSVMYTNPERVQYVFNENLTNFIKSIKEEQFIYVLKGVKKALGFDDMPDSSTDEENEALKNKIKNLESKIKEQDFKIKQKTECANKSNEAVNDSRYEITALKTERDLYKDLYEKILTKLLSA